MGDPISVQQLHDKATRGHALTPAEQARLQSWYDQQDKEEEALLAASAPQALSLSQSLRRELDESLAQLSAVTQRIQTLNDENEALRRDIVAFCSGSPRIGG